MNFLRKFFVVLLLFSLIVPVSLSNHIEAWSSDFYKIENSRVAPYNIIGKIQFNNGKYGTGFVIGKDTIVTNKHVARHLKESSGTFKLAINQFNRGKKMIAEFNLVSVKMAPNIHDDVAIMKVTPKTGKKQVGEIVRPANIKKANFMDEAWFKTSANQLHIAGYPGGKPNDTMWKSTGKITGYGFNNNRIYKATIKSQPGASGSPLFNQKNEIVGINSSNYGEEIRLSGGFLFKDDLYDFLIANR